MELRGAESGNLNTKSSRHLTKILQTEHVNLSIIYSFDWTAELY